MSLQHDLELAVQRVRDLHKINEYGNCIECSKDECWGCGEYGSHEDCPCQGKYPCPTIKALEGNHES